MFVRTERGVVRTKTVVIATGYVTPEFKPLAGRLRMMHTYVVATERLAADARRRLGLNDVMLWDTERPYHYLRWTRDRRIYPALAAIDGAFVWEGLFATTPDGLPYIGPQPRCMNTTSAGYAGSALIVVRGLA